MIKYDQTIDELLGNLKTLQKRLQKKVLEIASSNETSISFWSKMQRDVKYLYEGMRFVFTGWTENIPKEYYSAISQSIKDLKAIGFKSSIKITEIQNMHASSQHINTLLNDSISNFNMALDNGRKKINQVLRSTQQLNITENQVNQDISQGFEEGGSTFYSKRKLRDDLLGRIADGSTVKVIDINGKERNYDVNDYAEMVARTKLREAQTAGVIQTAMAVNEDLVAVSSNPGCDICNDYAGKIFSISGNDPDFPQLDDNPPFHPNCRHSLTIYVKDFQPDEQLQEDIERSN